MNDPRYFCFDYILNIRVSIKCKKYHIVGQGLHKRHVTFFTPSFSGKTKKVKLREKTWSFKKTYLVNFMTNNLTFLFKVLCHMWGSYAKK